MTYYNTDDLKEVLKIFIYMVVIALMRALNFAHYLVMLSFSIWTVNNPSFLKVHIGLKKIHKLYAF